jgi:RNA polymerase sigma-70 factor (ECF subfamily)
MNDAALNTVVMQDCLDRWQAGDRSAADELLRLAGARLEKLAKRMCRSFPNVREWAESSDVLQNSLIRLLRTLQSMRPKTTRDFFNLAAVHIRRELLDLARHFRVRAWVPLETHTGSHDSRTGRRRSEPVSPQAADLDVWARFHEAVDRLPTEEREVVGLVFYHDWTQVQIAQLFGVDERTIRRRWASAVEKLREAIGGSIPG